MTSSYVACTFGILCLRANGREILVSIISTSSLSGSILKNFRCASSAIRRARRKSSMRVPLPLASVRFIAASALNGLRSSSARVLELRACARCWRSTASTSARCFSSMNPALNRRSPRYETVISRAFLCEAIGVTVMFSAKNADPDHSTPALPAEIPSNTPLPGNRSTPDDRRRR